mgnify:CR=1 FL=1
MTWRHPIDSVRITDHYGDNEPPRTSPHRGTDYVTKRKGLLRAVNDAKVIDIYWSNCLGWVCAIKIDGSDWVFSYCHLNCTQHGENCKGPSAHPDGSNCMKNLKVGDSVVSGQPVGRQGNSGSCSRGSHCHLVQGQSKRSAVRGKTWDAYKYIEKQIKREAENGKTQDTSRREESDDTGAKEVPKKTQATLGTVMGRFWVFWNRRR